MVIIPNGQHDRKRPFREIDFENDSRRVVNQTLREQRNHKIMEEHERVRQQRREQQRNRRPRRGTARLSNTDNISRAHQVRSQLLSKLQEVAASEMEPRARNAMAADVQMQIDRVDQMITAIRRREQAVQAERTRVHNESAHERRRRQSDLQERSIHIRRELLHHTNDGGLNPNASPFGSNSFNPSSAVALELGGLVGSVDMPAPMPLPDTIGGGAEIVL